MQVLFNNLREDFKKYNIVSKYILKIGTAILLILSLIAVTTKLIILSDVSPVSLDFFFEDLLECIKESFGAIYFGAFALEVLHCIYLKQTA
ncbi:MAG: hypothetical protein J5877_04265 [Clostridia bacterium]|nr:hypothetical protein [Clostridia bacterium]